MEFSYRITEADYVSAWRLRCKAASPSSILKTILFWIFILFCLVLLWMVLLQDARSPTDSSFPSSVGSWGNPFPLVVSVALVIFLRFAYYAPRQVRGLYKKDPVMHGQFTVNITPDFISMRSTAGFSAQSAWSILDFWREGKDLLLVVFHSGAYYTISLAGLSEPQRTELRSILAAALPKK
ncbi:MAG TPA: hypothetical protein VMV57_10475 [Terracidiphilus sp.]|nr:hypothetical protein [Terracidiphilus sp.]